MKLSHDEIDDARCVLEEAMAATDTPWVAVTRTSLQIICAALAQQAQPLTDLDASRIALAVFDADGPDSLHIVREIIRRYEARRDRMTQQAQPEDPPENIYHELMVANGEIERLSLENATLRSRMPQQAQPGEAERDVIRVKAYNEGFERAAEIARRHWCALHSCALPCLICDDPNETPQQAQPRCERCGVETDDGFCFACPEDAP